MSESESQDKELLTVGEIAEMAGVSPSAVSNWRKRHSDFPAPAHKGPGGDLFSRHAVETWLENRPRRGKAAKQTRPRTDAVDAAWKLSDKMRRWGRLTQGRLLTWLQLLSLHRIQAVGPDPTGGALGRLWKDVLSNPEAGREAWHNLVVEQETALGTELARALTPASRVPSEDLDAAKLINNLFARGEVNHGEVADLLLQQEHAGKAGPSVLTSEAVSNLVIDLLKPVFGTLYDPAFGVGNVLTAGWKAREDEHLQLCGQEISRFNWEVAYLRLLLHGAKPILRTGDTLLDDRFRSLEAERVVVDPPWGGRKGAGEVLRPDDRWPHLEAPRPSEWLWVHHALFHLSNDGRAIALVPPGLSFLDGPDRSERAHLMESRVLDAVIDLPPGVVPGTGVAPTLLLFDRARNNRRDEILFIDARLLGTSRRGKTRDLDEDQRARILRLVDDWRAGAFEPEAALSGSATVREIEDQQGVWSPSRYIKYGTRVTEIDGEPIERRLDRLLTETGAGGPHRLIDGVNQLLHTFSEIKHSGERQWGSVRLSDLLVSQPQTGMRQDVEGPGELHPFVSTESLRKVGSAIREVPNAGTRGNVGSRLTRCEDLLLTSRGIGGDRPARCSIVLVEEALAYSQSLMRLRVDETQIDANYLRLFLTSQEGHMALVGLTSGTTISNIRPDALMNLEVPLPDLKVQREIVATAGLAENAVSALDSFSEEIRRLSQTVHEGLISGVLRAGEPSGFKT